MALSHRLSLGIQRQMMGGGCFYDALYNIYAIIGRARIINFYSTIDVFSQSDESSEKNVS